MKTILFLIITLFPLTCKGQTWVDLTASTVLQFNAGYHRGRADAAMFHYDRVKTVSPWYDNPQTSWKNKYKNGDPTQGPAFWGSTSAFVFLTDDWHFDNFIENHSRHLTTSVMTWGATKTASTHRQGWWCDITGIPNQRKPWWTYPTEYMIFFLANSAGFYTSYNFIYK